MRQVLLIWLFAISSTVQAQRNNYDNITDEKKADELLDKLRLKQATYNDKQELQRIAILLQNKAQAGDEYKKSLASVDKAIVLFDALDDTLNVANNRKFKGYLLGRFGKFQEAKKEIAVAIHLYQLKNMDAGVAISQFDLARMFEFQNKTDSAIYYANLCRSFWKSKEVDGRVLLINNMLVSLWLKASEPDKAKDLQEESALLIKKSGMHWQVIIDFYFTSMLLYKTLNDIGTAGDYHQLYGAKIEELRKTGITARSYYENDRE